MLTWLGISQDSPHIAQQQLDVWTIRLEHPAEEQGALVQCGHGIDASVEIVPLVRHEERPAAVEGDAPRDDHGCTGSDGPCRLELDGCALDGEEALANLLAQL